MKKDILGGESSEVFIVKENWPLLKISLLSISMVSSILFLKFVNQVNILELKFGFCKSSYFFMNATLTSSPLLLILSSLLGGIAVAFLLHPPKSDDK